MYTKNKTGQYIYVLAVNQLTGEKVTGDAANITAEWSKDGGTSAATNDTNPTEIDATDHPGLYGFLMTQTETNCDIGLMTPVSATDDIVLDPVEVHFFDPGALTASFEDSATIGTTEYSLPNDSTSLTARTESGVWQIMLDLNALSGDTYTLKVYEKVQSGGTQRVIYTQSLTSADGPHFTVPVSLALKHGWDVTLTKASGTNRAIGWSIRRVG